MGRCHAAAAARRRHRVRQGPRRPLCLPAHLRPAARRRGRPCRRAVRPDGPPVPQYHPRLLHRRGQRRRDAVDKVASLQFDRRGNRIWRDAKTLLDSELARRAIGEVAVPYGTCSEPSNVRAGGNSCPYRFRCAGCGHFRTDVSYLPDLHAYLDDLLRNRERVLAAAEIDQWARAEAVPSSEEITTIRSLITRIEAGLEDLTADEREQVGQAVALVRRHRTVTLGMPRMRQALPDIRPERTA
jgi:hypothetical protein